MTPERPEAVIFDCDGVLVDSERIANQVLAELLTEAGLPTTRDESMGLYMGRTMAACRALAEQRHGGPLPEALFEEDYYERCFAAFARELRPVPGIESALAALEHAPIPYCVASSGPPKKIRTTLGHTGLLPRFEGRITSAVEVAHGKPAPDVFLLAAERLGAPPAACCVVEDSVLGVRAARAAGMRVLGFARDVAAEALAAAGAEPFRDMRELPVRLGVPG